MKTQIIGAVLGVVGVVLLIRYMNSRATTALPVKQNKGQYDDGWMYTPYKGKGAIVYA